MGVGVASVAHMHVQGVLPLPMHVNVAGTDAEQVPRLAAGSVWG